TLTNAFAGGAEQSFTINMTQPTTGVFAIEVTVGGVTQTSTDNPFSDLQTTGATGPASRFSTTPLITLGGLINAVPTTAVNLVLFTNQGTGASTFNPANAPTIANLKISQY
ncbi:MAG: hypothetical protein RML34_09420, partial [Leptospiraceae bacterium]|nr:hypothetical protein [Leptospiraceae bacterium]